MYCAFCGQPWDNGLFFSAVVYARPPEQNQLNLLACRLCQVSLTDAQMQDQFDAAVGQGERETPAPARLNLLFCAFCGRPWGSGLFFGARVYARPPGQDKVPVIACHLCHATRPNAELQRQFDAAIGQVPAPVEHPDG